MNPRLQVAGLTTEFATRAGILRAVNDVSLELMPGEIVGLVGESGSGKSVTGLSLLGLIDPPGRIVAGSVKLDGEDIGGLSPTAIRPYRGKRIAMIFQDPMSTLNPVLTIGRQMALAIRAHGLVSRAEIEVRSIAALQRVGIPAPEQRLKTYPHELSGGMRQRVAIAVAFINQPSVVICDEPTTALDVSIQAQILVEMRTLARETGVSLIWISHDLATVSMLASRIMVMYAGRIIEEGPAAVLLSNPRHPYTRGLIDSLPASAKPGQDLTPIPGTTPSLIDLPKGCAFENRCRFASASCSASPERSVEADRAYRCHNPLGIIA
ncbi:DppD ABC-type dipeptide/oligopeptide/nickel transport system, ATPase component [Rhabdaerophilaceae bacterium]